MEELIDGILENFDFDKVKKTMDLLDWTYADIGEVPSTYQLIKSAKSRLKDAYKYAKENKKDGHSFSGGFRAFAEWNKEKETVDYLQLDFVVATWDEQIDYENI